MARKAVQGYPEKSYYDNTRYLGIVATTDPLNEGLFKHLVNFNISDTGQSVTPRKGLLTTTFTASEFASDLFISEVYEGTSNNKYIEIYNGTGVSVSLINYSLKLFSNGASSSSPTSVYVLPDIVLPPNAIFIVYNSLLNLSNFPSLNSAVYKAANSSITSFNGDDAIGLFKNNQLLDSFGNIGQDPGTGWPLVPTGSTLDHSVRRKINVLNPRVIWDVNEWEGFPINTDSSNNYGGNPNTHIRLNINYLSFSNQTIIFKDNNINEYIIYDFKSNLGYIADISAYRIEDKLLPVTTKIVNFNWRGTEDRPLSTLEILINEITYLQSLYSSIAGTHTQKLDGIQTYIQQNIKILHDSKVEHIYDENGIHKTLLKAELIIPNETNFKFILQLYYRKDSFSVGNITYPANTLNIDIVDTFNHPTLIPTERSVSVSKSIIPDTFQTLFTENNRPNGQVSNLGSFIYVYDDALNYVNNFIYRNTNYTIKPYFQLNPAFYDLNNANTATDKWAYKFEVINTSVTDFTSTNFDTIYSSPWLKYVNNTTKPERVFINTEQIRTGEFSLGNENITLNHYRNARYVVFVVPDEPNTTISTTSSFDSGEFKTDYPNYPTSNTFTSINNSWASIINTIKDISTLKKAIELFTNTLFYVVDLQSTSFLNPFNADFKTLTDAYQTKYTIKKDSSSNDTYKDNFITGSEFLKMIENKEVEFKKNSIAFRLLPFVANETHTTIDRLNATSVKYQWFFASTITNATTFTSDPLFKNQQMYISSGIISQDLGNNTRTQAGTNIYENSYIDYNSSSGVNSNHRVVVTTNNRVFVWGYNSQYQLGLGDNIDRTTPTLLTSTNPGFTNFIGVAVGKFHTYLLKSDSLFSFGNNTDGQLGDGTTTSKNVPTQINLIGNPIPPQYTAKAISSGSSHGVLLDSNGTVYTWGANNNGQLGRGNTTTGNTAPQSIMGSGGLNNLNLNEKVIKISSGDFHNVILTNHGRVLSWGLGLNGRLGSGDTINDLSPTFVTFSNLKEGEAIVSVSAGYDFSIFLTNFGRVFGTGSNTYGQLGSASNLTAITVPTLIDVNFLDVDETVVKATAGYRQTFLLTNKNKVIRFGTYTGTTANAQGTVVNFTGLNTDEFITEFNSSYADITSSSVYFLNMFITNLGKIYTFGNGAEGGLGIGISGVNSNRFEPLLVSLVLNENESIKTFKNKTEWVLIKTNVAPLPSTTTLTQRYFDNRTWTLYQGVAINNFLPYITTLSNTFDLYITKHNNFFVNNNYGFYKYNVLNGTYSLETNLNILKNMHLVIPVTFTSLSFPANQPPYYLSSAPNSAIYAIQGTVVHVIGTNGNSLGGTYIQQGVGTNNQWETNGGNTPPGFVFTKNGVYYNTTDKKYYIWENPTGTNGLLTEINNNANLDGAGFFDKGLSIIFYMKPYEESELLNKNYSELQTLQVAWNATALVQTMPVKQYGYDNLTVTYIEKIITKEAEDIKTSNNLTIFENSVLLTWYKNVLYISEVGRFYWFKDKNKLEFNEEIVKVIQYKTIILVFTTQNLYAVYRVETTTTTINPATNQLEQNVTGVVWVKQTVLYNLLVNKNYADVIQIFNQMVLFYSEDGQLFMIRPSTTIDDQTRFSIQYMNKAANDILKNYEVYINERLSSYGKKERIEKSDVKIKALISINYVKIFYYVPSIITYILIYDVLNNRYYVEDTLTVSNIYDKWFIESGEVYITELNNKIYFTFPFVENNTRDNYVDQTITNNFKKEGINCLIDTGNLNLNNHLYKRFRDLHVVFKNLNATDLLFNVETNIDEVIAKPFYSTVLEVQEVNDVRYIIPITKENNNDLTQLVDVNQISETASDALKYSLINNNFANNNLLLDFSAYTSSKLLTHRTSILGLGKVFRLKLQFVSKGLYKLQHFGIIYKERRI